MKIKWGYLFKPSHIKQVDCLVEQLVLLLKSKYSYRREGIGTTLDRCSKCLKTGDLLVWMLSEEGSRYVRSYGRTASLCLVALSLISLTTPGMV